MKKIKVSAIGAGYLGCIHIKLLSQNSSVDFVGIYDINTEVTKKQVELYNVSAFESIEDLIQHSDAVFLIIPTKEHYVLAKKILLAGTHIFIEKPVCSNVKEAEELLSISKQNPSLIIQIGHIERFNSVILEAQKHTPSNYSSLPQLYESGIVNPQFIEAHRLSQFTNRSTDVSVIYDLMIHDIDLVLWLVKSKVKQIDASGVSIITSQPDIANARIKFENGAVANLTASRISMEPMRKFRIFQQNCYMALDLANHQIEKIIIEDKVQRDSETSSVCQQNFVMNILGNIEDVTNKNIIYEKPTIPKINAMKLEQQSFFDAIYNGTTPLCTLQEGINALKVAEEINKIIMEY